MLVRNIKHFPKALLWLLVGPWLVACGAAPLAPEQSAPEQSPEQSPPTTVTTQQVMPEPAEPTTDLSPELLFRLMLAEIAGQRGHIGVAVKQYLAAAEDSMDPKVIERATRIAVYARDNDSALKAASLWTEVEPDSIEAHQVAAAMYVRMGNTEQAHQHLERVVELGDSGNRNTFMLITSLLGKERDKQTALRAMSQLVANRQDNPDALYAYAQLAVLVGELDTASSAVQRAISLRPDWADAHILYSNTLYRQGKKVQAMTDLEKAVNRYPANLVLRDYYARRLVDEKRYEEARDQFEELLVHAPNNAEAQYALGLLALQTRDLDASAKVFKKLVKQGKRVHEASYYLGQIAEQKEQTKEAMRWYSLVTNGQYKVDAQIRMAIIESQAGDLAQARERLSNLEPENAEMEQRLILAEGEILREAKLYQEAFDLFSEGLARLPGNVGLLYARALTAEKIERVDVTFSDLEQIIKLEPNNAQALNAYGYTLVDRTDRTQEGMQHIQKAYQIQPDDPAIMDSMGWAHYRLGNHQEALKYLRMAFAKLKDSEIAAHLGEVLWVLGDEDEARSIWEEALRETPSHKLLLDVIKRFTK